MKTAKREDIERNVLVSAPQTIPGMAVPVLVSEMSEETYEGYYERLRRLSPEPGANIVDITSFQAIRLWVAARCLVDERGETLFDADDIDDLKILRRKMGGQGVILVYNKAMELSGESEAGAPALDEEIEALKKAPGGFSSTDSPPISAGTAPTT